MLTDQACRAAKPGPKDRKLSDEKGLYLLVTTAGFKSWRWKYRFGGKERKLTFGPYPEVSLRQARDYRDDARRLLRDGMDPGVERKRAKARRSNGVDFIRSFKGAALHWHELQKPGWKPKHAAEVLSSLETELFPTLGAMALEEVRPADIRDLLVAIQARGALEAAHRLRARISRIYELAIANGLAEMDPAASIGAALKPKIKRLHPALLKLQDCRDFIRTFERAVGFPGTKLASRLLALTAARPGMIRFAELQDMEGLDTAEPIWRVPAEKMKLLLAESEQDAFEFPIPLSRQAVDVITIAAELAGRRKYLFPSMTRSHAPISENRLNLSYRNAGYTRRHVPHGWRSSFSTIMNERAIDLDRPGDRAIIDLMLAHKPQGVEAHYNRAAYMKRRRTLAQEWADMLLDGFPPAETLLQGPRRRR
jgi:hypothetical protein